MKIKIEVDGLTLEHATELTKFLSSLKSPLSDAEYAEIKKASVEMSEVIAVEEKPKQTRKRAEKVEERLAEVQKVDETFVSTKAEAEAEAIEVVEPETVSAPTLMQIRSLVAQKAGEHKDSIKAKLVELGAQNVSTLDAKHFQTIFDFLTEL